MAPVKLIFASDFAPIRHFAPLMKDSPAAVYGDLLDRLKKADYAIVNLESPLACPSGKFIAKSGAAFSGEVEHISSLAAGNFKAAVMANNHTFDCGYDGFDISRKLLISNGISVVGAGDDLSEARKPLAIEVNGVKIALFAISEGEDMLGATEKSPGVRPWEVDFLAQQIRDARKDFDVILISAHCGLEYQPYPSYYVYEAFEKFSSAGADMIIGHHPHVPQGMTFFGKTPAYFSLGNFVFYQPLPLFHRKTGYFLEFEVDRSGLISHKEVPYRIGDDALHLLAGAEKSEFEHLFAKLSAPLKTGEGALQAWHAVLAYNGIAGFENELKKILDTMHNDPVKGAAMLRNRVSCMQHNTQWIDGMSRIMTGEISSAPAELISMVEEFMTRVIEK
ncbi:MAG: CapA family protein [Lentisphaerae bacterium]|nr:CapA family protein [Lentisphaerota bacterium]